MSQQNPRAASDPIEMARQRGRKRAAKDLEQAEEFAENMKRVSGDADIACLRMAIMIIALVTPVHIVGPPEDVA